MPDLSGALLRLPQPATPPSGYHPSELLLSISDPASGAVLAEISLQIRVPGGRIEVMRPSSATPGEGTDANPDLLPVAGRIEAAPSGLMQMVDDWIAHGVAKGRFRGKTPEAYRQTVAAAARDCGWSSVGDLTYAAITGYLVGKRASGAWKAGTYNRNLVCFRSLTRWLRRMGHLAKDPLVDEQQVGGAAEEGSRAATLEEARAVILQAWMRQQTDRRTGEGNRALYWLCLFAHACRAGEPEQWRWGRHVFLDDEVPHILWTPEINKNGRLEECALAPELAEQLRRHRERMRELARATPVVTRRGRKGQAPEVRRVDPDDPEAFVFPWVPPRATFRADRERAGIAERDRRGRRFSPHSARKFFSTTLTDAGRVREKMVDRLMRHAGKVEARYYDPPLSEQAAAVARLPRLWPAVDNPVDNSTPSGADLTFSGVGRQHAPATPMEPPRNNSTKSPGHDWAGASVWQSLSRQASPGDSVDLIYADLLGGQLCGPALTEIGSTLISPVMPITGLITVDRTLLAGLLETLARELRQGAPRGAQPPQ